MFIEGWGRGGKGEREYWMDEKLRRVIGQSKIQGLVKSQRRGCDGAAGAGEVCEGGEWAEGEVWI